MLRLAWKDLWFLLRRPATLMWAFVMPVIFFSFIGKVTSGFSGSFSRADPLGVLLPADAGYLGDELLRLLATAKFQPVAVKSAAALQPFERRLSVPAGFTTSVLAGKAVKLSLTRKGETSGADYDRLRVQRAVYGLLAELIAAEKGGAKASPERLAAIAAAPRSFQVEVEVAGKRKQIPTGFQQSVPGTMVMFVLMVMLTGGAASLVSERRLGILRRLASSPLRRGEVVAAKWGSRLAIGVLQTLFAVLTGTWLFHVTWGDHPGAIFLLLAGYLALCASLGVLLGSLAKKEGQAVGLGTMAGNLLAALGGCWWPIEVTPQWMQRLALALPTGITQDGLHRLMTFGDTGMSVAPHIVALFAMAAVVSWLAARCFSFE